MNWKQKAVLTAGFILVLATGIYPPWVQSWTFAAGGEDVWYRIEPGAESYSWIFSPPGTPNWVDGTFRKPGDKEITEENMKHVLNSVRMPGTWRAHIDMRRLLIEWAIIAAGVFVGVLTLARPSGLGQSK